MGNEEVKKRLIELSGAKRAIDDVLKARVHVLVNEMRQRQVEELREIARSLQPAFDLREHYSALVAPIRETAVKLTSALVDVSGLKESAARLGEARVEAQAKLWQAGWMVSMDMPIPLAIDASELLQEDPEGIDEALTEFFEERLDQMEEELARSFPQRATVVRAIVAAHKAGQYEVAIPATFAQCDGICHELLGVQLYSNKKGKPVVATEIQGLELSDFWVSIISVIGDTGPMNASENQRADLQFEEAFNRHRVMHGEASDYGTRTNSARAISLLNFVGTVLQGAVSKQEK